MKSFMKKTFSVFMALLLLLPTVMMLWASAAISPLPGQKILPVAKVDVPVFQDGRIDGDEYGSVEPTLRLTAGNGFWAEDMEGNPISENLPSYIDLYLAQKDDMFFVGIVVQENAHEGEQYVLDAFLGFGDDTNSHTMNSGNTTSYLMKKMTRAKYLREWMDMRPTSHTAQIVDENGVVTESTPYYDALHAYPLIHWGEISTDENGTPLTTYEIEMSFHDAVVGSGKEWSNTPDVGYFAFDLALFSGTEQSGTLHFRSDLKGAVGLNEDSSAESVPHILDLAGDSEIDMNERVADLSSLAMDEATLSPAFDPAVFDYTAKLSFGRPAVIRATAKAAESGATVLVSGADELGTDQSGTVTVLVTAKSGYQKAYRIYVERDYIYNEYSVGNAAELETALGAIRSAKFTPKDAVRLLISGEIALESEILFDLSTVFNNAMKKVPIFVVGTDENASLTLAEGSVSAANDYIFQDLKMPIAGQNVSFFAGCGNVVFDSVDFGEAEEKAKFFGDTCTADVFDGWTDANFAAERNDQGKIETSVTFSGTTVYTPSEKAGVLMGAVGFDGESFGEEAVLSPEKMTASFIVDGATVSVVGARLGTSPVSLASVSVRSGNVQAIYGDNGKGLSGEMKIFSGKTELFVSGGNVGSIRSLYRTLHKGNFTILVEEANAEQNPVVIGDVLSAVESEVRGNHYLTINGGTFTGDVSGSSANLSTYNRITGATIKGSFFGINRGSTSKIINNLTDTGIGANYYGGNGSGGFVRGVTNNLVGCSFGDTAYGGSRSGILYGNIKNNVTECVANESFFGGNATGTVNGNITNIIKSNSFTNSYAFVNVDEQSDVALMPCFAGGNEAGKVLGNITNTARDNSFGKTYSGTGACDVGGNVKNTLIGGNSFIDSFIGGSSSLTIPSVIEGNIINTVMADAKGYASYFGAKSTSWGIAYVGGHHGLGDSKIVGGIVNDIQAATLSTRYFGGSLFGGTDNSIGRNEYGESVTNLIRGGTFSNVFNGGGINIYPSGNIGTYISDGTFNSNVTGGNRGVVNGFDQTIVLNISGGTFVSAVYGAAFGLSPAQKAYSVNRVEMNISGGTFKNAVYLGGKGSTPMNSAELIITGGSFEGNIRLGSESVTTNTTTAIIEAKDGDVFLGGVVKGRSENETVTLKGNGKKLLLDADSSVIFNSYDGAAQTVTLTESAVADSLYLQVPAESADGITFEGNVSYADGQWIGAQS